MAGQRVTTTKPCNKESNTCLNRAMSSVFTSARLFSSDHIGKHIHWLPRDLAQPIPRIFVMSIFVIKISITVYQIIVIPHQITVYLYNFFFTHLPNRVSFVLLDNPITSKPVNETDVCTVIYMACIDS